MLLLLVSFLLCFDDATKHDIKKRAFCNFYEICTDNTGKLKKNMYYKLEGSPRTDKTFHTTRQ